MTAIALVSVVSVVLSLLALLCAILPYIPVTHRRTLLLILPNFFLAAWAHYVAAAGAIAAALGWVTGAPVAVVAGLAGALLAAVYVRRATAPTEQAFERGLGADWKSRVPHELERRMLRYRWRWTRPGAPAPEHHPDLGFATLPGGRTLLCDVWEPAAAVPRSGVAVVYLHGSAWSLLDKDSGTRRFFAQLAAQGHVVVDVAYRLCPETDGVGMVGDAKRAVAWIKAHAAEYQVNPRAVVLMGGSAGAHIALLAAYSADEPELTPPELRGVDTTVAAVVSYYGVTDLRAYERYARTFLPPGPLPPAAPRPALTPKEERRWRRLFGDKIPVANLPPPPPHATLMHELAGGLPHEVPERFELLSPICKVTPHSPPTLLFQAQFDNIVPIESARALYRTLLEAHVPVVYVELPGTLHAFDLMYPALFAPAAQSALYDCERFLAWVASSVSAATQTAPSVAA